MLQNVYLILISDKARATEEKKVGDRPRSNQLAGDNDDGNDDDDDDDDDEDDDDDVVGISDNL